MTASDLAARLNARRSGSGWTANCPAHPDRDPSLSISEAPDGKVLLHCHAGCAAGAVCDAIGISLRDLMPPGERRGRNGTGQARIVAEYPYTDENGALLFEVVRFDDPKDFKRRRPDGKGGHIWNTDGVRRVLFRLPEVLAAVRDRKPVWIAEGEKDCLNLARTGLCSTTNAGGAKKWLPEYSEVLRGVDVVVLPDNDAPGRAHADIVARSLHGIARSVRVVRLPDLAAKGDVSDWLKGTDPQAAAAELRKLAKATPVFDPTTEPEPMADEPDRAPCERPIPISEVPIRRIEWLWPGRLARGEITEICGDPGLGKSMLGVEIAALLSRGSPWPDATRPTDAVSTLLLSAEDDAGSTIRPRLEAADADLRRVFVLPADRVVTVADVATINGMIASESIGLLVLDPLGAFLPGTTDSHRDAEVRAVMMPLVLMARERGCAVLTIRHLNKGAGQAAVYRGGGSIAFTALVRFAFAVARHPDNRTQRVFACVKNNLAAEPPSIVYEVVPANDVARIAWRGTCDLTAEQVLNRSAADTPADDAAQFLGDALRDGPQPARDVEQQAASLGISRRTLARSRHDLRVVSRKDGRAWTLALPKKDASPETNGTLPEGRMPHEGCQPWHSCSGTLPEKDAKPSENGTLPDFDTFEEF
ncbi:MAG: hypothetical protein FJX72_07745 [Armatimonadetes bacterium]|nr:hypothetical protein [Armatimonadota bacterium]